MIKNISPRIRFVNCVSLCMSTMYVGVCQVGMTMSNKYESNCMPERQIIVNFEIYSMKYIIFDNDK